MVSVCNMLWSTLLLHTSREHHCALYCLASCLELLMWYKAWLFECVVGGRCTFIVSWESMTKHEVPQPPHVSGELSVLSPKSGRSPCISSNFIIHRMASYKWIEAADVLVHAPWTLCVVCCLHERCLDWSIQNTYHFISKFHTATTLVLPPRGIRIYPAVMLRTCPTLVAGCAYSSLFLLPT